MFIYIDLCYCFCSVRISCYSIPTPDLENLNMTISVTSIVVLKGNPKTDIKGKGCVVFCLNSCCPEIWVD